MNYHQLVEKYVEPEYQVLVEQIIAKANLNPSSAKLEKFVQESIEKFVLARTDEPVTQPEVTDQ